MNHDVNELMGTHEIYPKFGKRTVLVQMIDGTEYEVILEDGMHASSRNLTEGQKWWIPVFLAESQKDCRVIDWFEPELAVGQVFKTKELCEVAEPGVPILCYDIGNGMSDAILTEVTFDRDKNMVARALMLGDQWGNQWAPDEYEATAFQLKIVDWFDFTSQIGGPCRCEWIEVLKNGCNCGSIKRYQEAA